MCVLFYYFDYITSTGIIIILVIIIIQNGILFGSVRISFFFISGLLLLFSLSFLFLSLKSTLNNVWFYFYMIMKVQLCVYESVLLLCDCADCRLLSVFNCKSPVWFACFFTTNISIYSVLLYEKNTHETIINKSNNWYFSLSHFHLVRIRQRRVRSATDNAIVSSQCVFVYVLLDSRLVVR